MGASGQFGPSVSIWISSWRTELELPSLSTFDWPASSAPRPNASGQLQRTEKVHRQHDSPQTRARETAGIADGRIGQPTSGTYWFWLVSYLEASEKGSSLVAFPLRSQLSSIVVFANLGVCLRVVIDVFFRRSLEYTSTGRW